MRKIKRKAEIENTGVAVGTWKPGEPEEPGQTNGHQRKIGRCQSSSIRPIAFHLTLSVGGGTQYLPSRDCAHSDRSTANVEADRIAGEGHHARYLHSVAEAGSIVLHVSNNMNEGNKK